MPSQNLMPSQDDIAKNAKTQDKPLDDSAPKAATSPEEKRELTDDEIATVAGGASHTWKLLD